MNSPDEVAKKVGDRVEAGEVVCYIEAMKTFNAIKSDTAGVITSIRFGAGDTVSEDDILMTIA